MRGLRLAMAQINPVVGDIRGNARKILDWADRAKDAGACIVLFPELALTGYPPEDLLLKPGFIDDNLRQMDSLAARLRGITAIVGFVDRKAAVYNAAAVVHKGRVAGVYHKMYLPNYGVFDEQRYFRAGERPLNIVLNDVTIGIGICEDIWYPEGPARAQCLAGAEVIANINASPFHMGKSGVRQQMLSARARDNKAAVAYNNTVGGQDELVFDGRGMILDEQGEVLARAKAFEEDLVVADLEIERIGAARSPGNRRKSDERKAALGSVERLELGSWPARKRLPRLAAGAEAAGHEGAEEVLSALVLGTGDYVRKNGFRHAVVGLSGGMDSSLVAAVAARALGGRNITGVLMPSRYTSRQSVEDAEALALNLGIKTMTIPIEPAFTSCLKMLKAPFCGTRPDKTEENLQARIRGNMLMALSNKFGWLVLTTGNKSEMSVGYATLYGDMAGGFAVIKDLPKTMVYSVGRALNERSGAHLIPERVFTKAPTAELRPGQTDQDTLPPYEVLDRILKAYVEEDRSIEEITALGFKKALVRRVARMVDLSEYKRRQAPPGVKITPRALGKDRRMPITNRYENGSR